MSLTIENPALARGDRGLYRKIALRIVPFLFLCYFFSFLDRINVGFGRLQMSSDLGLSDAAYGLGAGIFFVGYFLFEVPSNILLSRIGARLTFCRIMILWGLVSGSMMFVKEAWQFNLLRFLLGAFEAGFFPGLVLYLTYWFPPKERATVLSWFVAGAAIAGMVGSPASGWIMRDMAGTLGLHGWQWMFLLEGLPACLLGVAAYFVLEDNPAGVRWLSANEKAVLLSELDAERSDKEARAVHSMAKAFASARVYLCVFVYFTITCGASTVNFWLPTLVKGAGVSDVFKIGMYSAIPYLVGALGTVALSMSSDRWLERRLHLTLSLAVGAVALAALARVPADLTATVALLSLATGSIFGASVVFWAVPPMFLSGTGAAAGIALISSFGSLGGFVSPYAIGLIAGQTGRATNGLYLMAGLVLLGAVVLGCGFGTLRGRPR